MVAISVANSLSHLICSVELILIKSYLIISCKSERRSEFAQNGRQRHIDTNVVARGEKRPDVHNHPTDSSQVLLRTGRCCVFDDRSRSFRYYSSSHLCFNRNCSLGRFLGLFAYYYLGCYLQFACETLAWNGVHDCCYSFSPCFVHLELLLCCKRLQEPSRFSQCYFRNLRRLLFTYFGMFILIYRPIFIVHFRFNFCENFVELLAELIESEPGRRRSMRGSLLWFLWFTFLAIEPIRFLSH